MRIIVNIATGLAAFLSLACGPVMAEDVAGGTDLSLISRYEGSRLVAYQDEGFASVTWPAAYDRNGMSWAKVMTVEGERQRRVYLAPTGRKALEVQRNYEAALSAAGATKVLACSASERCALTALSNVNGEYTAWLSDTTWKTHDRVAFPAMNGSGNEFHAIYKLARSGRTYFITVLTVDGASEGTGTVIDVVSPKAMEDGKVSVASADAIGQGLKAEGKVAVYGINFDTGKDEIKPDSRPQLSQMAKVLMDQPTLKVFIVGHTDNQGTVESNLLLSQHRAIAIVAALTHEFAIAANRLQPRGLANFAPIASNATEEGRARNRRVELVVQ